MKLTHRAIVSLMLGSSISLCFSCVACQAGPTTEQKSAHPNAGANAGIAWTQYQDPNEHAFTLDVPRGWTVKGGMFRFGYSDARLMVDMHSPDGKIEIQLGDARVPVYVIPDRLHNQEGAPYDLGEQGQLVIAKYHTGPEFAALYSQIRFHGECRNPQPDPSAPEFVAPSSAQDDDTGVKESSTGQITYRCDSDGGPRVAFAYVKTANYGTLWAVPSIASYLVPPDEVSTARDILRHCAQSFHLTPEWLQYKARLDAEGMQYQRARQQYRMQQLAQQEQVFAQKMQSMRNQADAFEQHMAQERSQFDQMDDVINGVTPTTDPLTGETRKVWTGTQNNYWANGLGQVVNSNNNPNPNGNWHQLQVGSQ
jgi:hypothetical protein